MLVLIFDTETTGLSKSKIISPDTLDMWPHIVQFSYILFDTETNKICKTNDFIIRLDPGVNIPDEASNIHGITNEISREKGTSIQDAMGHFFYHLQTADMLVGHNVSFDNNMLKVELLRIIYNKKYPQYHISAYKRDLHYLTNFENVFCTMMETIELCKIETISRYGEKYNKYPRLSELHNKLFDTVPNMLHNSLVDILATLRCFMKLKYDRDLLTDETSNFKETVRELEIF
jgi:DNA polymerase III epsilon subunit-like protein